MTKASLTDRQAITSTPLPLISAARCLKPGRCLAEQVGVNAPGSAKSATFLPLKSSSAPIGLGPSGVASVTVTLGSLSPTLMVIRRLPGAWSLADSVKTARRKPDGTCALERAKFKGKSAGDGRRILRRPAADRHARHRRSPVRAGGDPGLRPRRPARDGHCAQPAGRGADGA